MSVISPDEPAALLATTRPTAWLPREDVPVVINSFNRLDCLRELISWLVRAGQRRLYVVDNASEFPPLLAYLDRLQAGAVATVVRLRENEGHLAIWRHNLLGRLGIDTEFVYTDPDVVPAASCPNDLIGLLQRVLIRNPEIAVAGPGLRLDDLPDSYRFKKQAIDWERQYWRAPAAAGLFLAPIDTTFALYRPGSGYCLHRPAIRTGWPYVAAHRGWYLDDARLSDEERFYRRTALSGTSYWSGPALPEVLAAGAREQERAQPRLLQIAPPGEALPGYTTVLSSGEIDAPAASVDGIYVVNELSVLDRQPQLAAEFLRVAKPGGRMVIHTRNLDPLSVRNVLRRQSAWTKGWRLLKAVIAPAAGNPTGADPGAYDGPADGLMLHLGPNPVRDAGEHAPPDYRFGDLDLWAGFAIV